MDVRQLGSRWFFNQGDELIRVEALDYETALSRAEAALLRAEAELEHPKFELMRMVKLEERNLFRVSIV